MESTPTELARGSGGGDLLVSELSVMYSVGATQIRALDRVSLNATKGSSLGIVGESGCGKSTLAWTMIRALPLNAKVTSGRVFIDNSDILKLSEQDFDSEFRWKKIALIPQSSMNMFNPVFRIHDQIAETIRVHSSLNFNECVDRAFNLLKSVGIDYPPGGLYPHQLSGGMKQRAAIALALALSPKILIADEPTTALDVIVQAQIMSLIDRVKSTYGMTLMLISHDISLVSHYTNFIAVMYAGRVVEVASTKEIISNPLHPYTSALLRSIPNVKGPRTRVQGIAGSPPDLSIKQVGCVFAQRCPLVQEKCRSTEPLLTEVRQNHYSACLMWEKLQKGNTA